MTGAERGLRERKKQRTRETIARTALELFDRQGYAETTIAEIAAAAEVSPGTVTGYFPAKEDLVFPDEEEALATLRSHLERRPAGQMAPEALRSWLREWLEKLKGREEELRAQHRVLAAEESLRAHRQLGFSRIEALLAEAIAADVEATDPDDLEVRMAAASTTAIVVLLDEHFGPGTDPDGEEVDIDAMQEEVLAMLDRAVVFVSAGIAALRDSRAS